MGDISGEWNFSLNVQGQSGSAVATIRQNDEEIEGTYVGQRFGTVDFVGTIVDGELDFQLNLDLGPIIYEGRLQDDGSIKGTLIWLEWLWLTLSRQNQIKDFDID